MGALAQRRYTQQSANALLPEVREHLQRLQAASVKLAGIPSSGNGGGPGASDWLEASKSAAEELSWFGEAGIIVRDVEAGMVDFPTVREGREVYLCWRSDEPSVQFWHGPEGFSGRRPL
ncbi:MAG TPA: DUF2203 domain-containing protein [Actinomycetota bacterium]|nr:DUF2203 domain-containing protein [Actinomycetota bacterium]